MSDKRKRSSSPEPMAKGVRFNGFLSTSENALKKYKDNKVKYLGIYDSNLENGIEYMFERSAGISEQGGFKGIVQFTHSLLEIAAAATNTVRDNADETSKLNALHAHILEGMKLIGAKARKEEEESGDDDE
jgi:hypothetical protein